MSIPNDVDHRPHPSTLRPIDPYLCALGDQIPHGWQRTKPAPQSTTCLAFRPAPPHGGPQLRRTTRRPSRGDHREGGLPTLRSAGFAGRVLRPRPQHRSTPQPRGAATGNRYGPMNRTDVFTRTAIEVISPLTLTEFVSKVVASGPIAAAPVIIEATYEHVITPRYELIPTTLGVTGRTLSGSTSEMTWIEIASLLANVATTERVGALRRTRSNPTVGSTRSVPTTTRPDEPSRTSCTPPRLQEGSSTRRCSSKSTTGSICNFGRPGIGRRY